MYSLFKKEIVTFLGSLMGYLAIIVFLLVTGLFLWVFPGIYNIPDNGYATLEGLFNLAPWLYLFLIPAITMRLFADEKGTGTIEILLTRPVSDFKIVWAKFLAGMVLVIFSLLPTLIYFLSVYLLGNPVGSIDIGATWGSFIGLFFLAAIYVAIGLFASSLSENQIVSFILALVLSFVFYQGFDFIASSGIPYILEILFSWISINNHYLSISKGVVDMRDMIYFVGITFLFLFVTTVFIRKGKWKNKKTRINTVALVILFALIFFVSSNFLFRFDLTSDKRYSLSGISKEVVSGFDDQVLIELYLAGEMEPGLRKIQNETLEKIAVLNAYSSKPIRIRVFDPYTIKNKDKYNDFIAELVQKGIKPVSFNRKTDKGVSNKVIFPGAIIKSGEKEIAVNLLKNNPEFSYEVNFNHSVESVEFELVNAFQKLIRTKKSNLAFLEGHDEANRFEVQDISNWLASDFQITRIHAEDLRNNSTHIDILIIANPKTAFSEKDKFLIDQYIMKGGKTMWLIDPVQVNLDSLRNGLQTYSFPVDLNLGDMFFRYGFRLNYELLQDVYCAQIPVNTALKGNQPRFTLHPWYYSPLLTPSDHHPASKNLNRVFTEFVSSIDTISGNTKLKKSVILSTSKNSRKVSSPSSVSLQNINNPPARELFNLSNIAVGIIIEGNFTSVFQNRMVENIGFSSGNVIPESKTTKMAIIADGGIITNRVNYSTNPPAIEELGYDWVSKQTFGNREFLLNSIRYLNDESGLMQLKNRTLKLRLLDKVKLREEKSIWQWINTLIPIILVILFALVYTILRKHTYSR